MSKTSIFFTTLVVQGHLLFQLRQRFPMRLINTLYVTIDFILNHRITTVVSYMQYVCNILDVDATQQVCFIESLYFLL